MRRGLILIESTRAWMLAVSLPQAAMWSLAKGSGGGWMIACHSALVLIYVISLDMAFLRAGLDPRLSFVRDRFRHDERVAELSRAVLLALLGLASIGALFVEIWLSVFSVAVAALVLLRVRNATGEVASRRLLLAELIVPALAILMPALLIGSWEWGTELEATRGQRVARTAAAPASGVMGGDVVGSAVAITIMLAIFFLLCMLRDEAVDRLSGQTTTVTRFGREVCVLYAFVLLVACLVLCAYGAGAEWWGPGGWRIVALVALATMIVVWSLSNHTEGRGAGAWLIAMAISSILMASGVMTKDFLTTLEAIAEPAPAPPDTQPASKGPIDQESAPVESESESE